MKSWLKREREAGDVAVASFEEDLRKRGGDCRGKGNCLSVCFGVLYLHSGYSADIVYMEINVSRD